MTTNNPLQTGFSRVFLIEGGARPDHAASYESCLRLNGPSQDFGDLTKIECPDPFQYNRWITKGSIKGEVGRPTATLEGRYLEDIKSTLLRLARKGCKVDVQMHAGQCQDPSDFLSWDKVLILEGAGLIKWSADDMGALASGDAKEVNETSDVSADDMYEVVPLSWSEKAGSIVTNEVLAGAICDTLSCGDCQSESDGVSKIFLVTKQAGGSPSTPPDIVYSIDKGVTWKADDIDTMATAEDPGGITCVGSYICIGSTTTPALHYALKQDFIDGIDPVFTKVTTGFVAGKGPLAVAAIGNRVMFAAQGGYIYVTDDITAGVTAAEAGVLTSSNMNDIKMLSKTFAVAVGNAGVIMKTIDGVSWSLSTGTPVGVGVNLNRVWLKDENVWWVTTSNGKLYYTTTGGKSWVEKTFSGSGAGVSYGIRFATPSVGYLTHASATPRGRVLRTIDGGNTWKVCPENQTSLVNTDRFNFVLCSGLDVNFAVLGGLHDNGSDGVVVVGRG